MRHAYRRRISVRSLVWIGLVSLLSVGCGPVPKANDLPPLLRNVTAGGGHASPCPPSNKTEVEMLKGWGGKLAISPEFDARLRTLFPPGSPVAALENALRNQEFKIDGVCRSDISIHRAEFFRKGKGPLPYDVSAQVFWKADEEGHIAWTKGFVMYSGL
ncbi:hypothetical protein AB4Z48_29280 [Cupriavidus sp. 2TAF22]|uniref:hypothetical protein n=1 Tax=unclassified Cupriavidus TaxID=2640874 RepID=UPI003F90315A